MGKALNLENQKFGRLKAIKIVGSNKHKNLMWLCLCICGNKAKVSSRSLISGNTKSCGCLNLEVMKKNRTKHGMYSTVEYRSWASMIQRCTNKKHPWYPRYGGRGVKVCDRWRSFSAFYADMGRKPKSRNQIDRIENNRGYFSSNCRWASSLTNNRNNSTTKLNVESVKVIKYLLKNKQVTQKKLAETYKVSKTTISSINIECTWKDITI